MARKSKYILLFLFSLLMLAGCKSSKTATTAPADVEQIRNLITANAGTQGVSAKVKMEAYVNGRSLSSPGNIKVKRGAGVQLSVTPLGLFEAGRVEFLPLYAQYINRIKGEYSQLYYSAVPQLKELGISYELLESVLLNSIYVPAGTSMEALLKSASVVADGDNLLLTTKIKDISYVYSINTTTGELVQSTGTHAKGTTVKCVYSDFQSLGERAFPSRIELSFGGDGKSLKLTLDLSRIKGEVSFNPATPSPSYEKVAPASLLNLLGGK